MEPILKLNAAERRLEDLATHVKIINMRVEQIEKKLIEANIQTYYEVEVHGYTIPVRWDAENEEFKFRLSWDEGLLINECTETKVDCLVALSKLINDLCEEGEGIIKRLHTNEQN